MSTKPKASLQHKVINGWSLFWLISISMSVAMLIETLGVGISTAASVSHLIGFSVRWAVPFIYVVVAASALPVLFPGLFSSWLLRNRRYVGLCFAVAMAWQALFIFLMSNFYRDYYFEEIYYLRDELEGSTGYLFLTALVMTSFRFGRRLLSQPQWKLLHRSSVYFLWAYPFSVYWWALSYYENPEPLDYFYYWAGFLAFALRIAAWGKKRWQGSLLEVPVGDSTATAKWLGSLLIGFGLVVAATGLQWQEPVTEFLLAPGWSANLVLWLPFWPFEPYLSLLVIGLGVRLVTNRQLPEHRFWQPRAEN